MKTDLSEQHARLNSQHPGVILLLRVGIFLTALIKGGLQIAVCEPVIALVLPALAICLAAPSLVVVTADTVATVGLCCLMRTDSGVAARSDGDTAHSGRGEHAQEAECAGGGPATAVGQMAILQDLGVVRDAGPRSSSP